MAFDIESSGAGPLPQEAMRRIVEAVDGWRGRDEAFVVLQAAEPYEVQSVHATAAAARTAVGDDPALTYFGPVVPRNAATAFKAPVKTIGCIFLTHETIPAFVVFLDADDNELARYTVNALGQRAPIATDIEAAFLTPSGVDKFVMPYLTRVFGPEYAAAKREEYITD